MVLKKVTVFVLCIFGLNGQYLFQKVGSIKRTRILKCEHGCLFYIKKKYTTHSRFRGSVNFGALTFNENFFKSIFNRLQVFFCLVQRGPVVILVVCIGPRQSYRWSLRSARAVSETFWTVSLNWDTVPKSCAHSIPKNILEHDYFLPKSNIKAIMAPMAASSS